MVTAGRMTTVAVDASWLGEGGIGRMAHEIIIRAPNHVRVLEMRSGRRNAGPLTPLDLAVQARRIDADVVWSPGFMPPAFRVPKKRVFITIHDLTHLHHYSISHRIYYHLLIRRLLRNVDCVFTVSEFTRREILSWAPIVPNVVRIYNGVSPTFGPSPKYVAADPPYVLYVGNRRTYKNIERMMSAFARSNFAARGGELWLTGPEDSATSHTAARAGVADRVRYLGTLSDAELAAAYSGARALLLPSLYEGFGLPLVEAMATGCPVLTSNSTALAEIGGSAALTVDPRSTDSIADGIDSLCFDASLRQRLRAAGFKRAADFNWDQCAARYWQVVTGA